MKVVDYDGVASTYDRRYVRNRYDGILACLHTFIHAESGTAVAEVGCGTGHWLADLSQDWLRKVAGLDLSAGMLEQARAAAPTALLVRGSAERLPWRDACFDRIFCVNALHHFKDPESFIFECRRVLRPGGGLLTIGLDPHTGRDRWWVYDFFPAALLADRQRYPSTSKIREWLAAAGFRQPATQVAQHILAEKPFEAALTDGLVDRRATSQLLVISDADYESGIRRLAAERPVLRSDVLLYATTAWT